MIYYINHLPLGGAPLFSWNVFLSFYIYECSDRLLSYALKASMDLYLFIVFRGLLYLNYFVVMTNF